MIIRAGPIGRLPGNGGLGQIRVRIDAKRPENAGSPATDAAGHELRRAVLVVGNAHHGASRKKSENAQQDESWGDGVYVLHALHDSLRRGCRVHPALGQPANLRGGIQGDGGGADDQRFLQHGAAQFLQREKSHPIQGEGHGHDPISQENGKALLHEAGGRRIRIHPAKMGAEQPHHDARLVFAQGVTIRENGRELESKIPQVLQAELKHPLQHKKRHRAD